MKKLLIALLLCCTLEGAARQRPMPMYRDDNTGWCVAGTGMVFSIVALTVRDGSQFTYNRQGVNQVYVRRPFMKQPGRVCMLGIGITLTFGGLIYQTR